MYIHDIYIHTCNYTQHVVSIFVYTCTCINIMCIAEQKRVDVRAVPTYYRQDTRIGFSAAGLVTLDLSLNILLLPAMIPTCVVSVAIASDYPLKNSSLVT